MILVRQECALSQTGWRGFGISAATGRRAGRSIDRQIPKQRPGVDDVLAIVYRERGKREPAPDLDRHNMW